MVVFLRSITKSVLLYLLKLLYSILPNSAKCRMEDSLHVQFSLVMTFSYSSSDIILPFGHVLLNGNLLFSSDWSTLRHSNAPFKGLLT